MLTPNTRKLNVSNFLIRKLKSAALVSVMLLSACPRPIVLPDERVPHQIADNVTVKVWCHGPNDTWVKCEVTALKGWWLASPMVVDGQPRPSTP
jgi:hypothetical protein